MASTSEASAYDACLKAMYPDDMYKYVPQTNTIERISQNISTATEQILSIVQVSQANASSTLDKLLSINKLCISKRKTQFTENEIQKFNTVLADYRLTNALTTIHEKHPYDTLLAMSTRLTSLEIMNKIQRLKQDQGNDEIVKAFVDTMISMANSLPK